MKRILATIAIGEKFLPVFEQVWKRVCELEIPTGCNIDYFVGIPREEAAPEIVEFFNKLGIELHFIDIPWGNFKPADPAYVDNMSLFTEKTAFKVAEMRNKFLSYALENGYDYRLSIDADVIPPIDGLVKLFNAQKEYIDGWIYDRVGQCSVFPDKLDFGEVYDAIDACESFSLEDKKLFTIKYSLFDNRPNGSDHTKRLRDIRLQGIKTYVHPEVYCDHLKNQL